MHSWISCLLLSCCLLLTGCVDAKPIELLGFIHTSAFDLSHQKDTANEPRLFVTFSVPEVNKQAESKRELLFIVANSPKEARLKLSRQTNYTLVSGQLRNVLFSLDVARQGMNKMMDSLLRDPTIGSQVKITLVEGNAHELLKKEYKEHPRTSQYIDRMLEKGGHLNAVPKVNLYRFQRDLLDDGIDAIAPIIRGGKNSIIINGLGAFNGDRFVKKLSPKEARMLLLIREPSELGEVVMNVGSGSRKADMLLYSNIKSKSKIRVESVEPAHPERTRVHIDMELQGSVLEYEGKLDPSSPENQKKLEKKLEKHISHAVQNLVHELQQSRSDAIGIGQYVRNSMSYREWKDMDWKKVYPKIDVRCHVRVKIRDYGKIE